MTEELRDGVEEANELQDHGSLEMEGNEIEKSKVAIMRAVVEAEDSSAKVYLFLLLLLFSFSIFLYHFFYRRIVSLLSG